MDRRVYLTTVAGVALAGCSRLSSTDTTTQSWATAFTEGTTEADRSRLAKTPVEPAAVTTRGDVETALAVLGWNRASHEVPESVLADIDSLAETTGTASQKLRAGTSHLDAGLDLVEEMKARTEFGRSAWDVATTAAPLLRDFVGVARSLQARISGTADRLATVSQTTNTVAAHVRSIQATETTLYGQYPADLDAARAELERLTTDLTDISGDIETIRTISRSADAVAADLPMMGDRVGAVFGRISEELAALAATVEETHGLLGSLLAELNAIRDRAAETANDRYGPIHEAATGSTATLDVTTIDTTVDAYDPDDARIQPSG